MSNLLLKFLNEVKVDLDSVCRSKRVLNILRLVPVVTLTKPLFVETLGIQECMDLSFMH